MKPASFKGHTGLFSVDSPALYNRLTSIFDQETMVFLETAYSESFRLGGHNEAPIIRAPGVSYNPRPARLCHILVSELGETNPLVLAGAMLLNVPKAAMSTLNPILAQVACMIDKCLESSIGERRINPGIERLFLVRLLDDLRHLHMSTLEKDQINQFRSNTIQSFHPQNARLQILLDNILEKSSRRAAR